jgi:hypothetical protein
MEWLLGLETIIGMAFLRVVVPVGITLLLGYFLRRLNAKWQAEAGSIVTR